MPKISYRSQEELKKRREMKVAKKQLDNIIDEQLDENTGDLANFEETDINEQDNKKLSEINEEIDKKISNTKYSQKYELIATNKGVFQDKMVEMSNRIMMLENKLNLYHSEVLSLREFISDSLKLYSISIIKRLGKNAYHLQPGHKIQKKKEDTKENEETKKLEE